MNEIQERIEDLISKIKFYYVEYDSKIVNSNDNYYRYKAQRYKNQLKELKEKYPEEFI